MAGRLRPIEAIGLVNFNSRKYAKADITHIREPIEPPPIIPTRRPPDWDDEHGLLLDYDVRGSRASDNEAIPTGCGLEHASCFPCRAVRDDIDIPRSLSFGLSLRRQW